VSRDTRIRYKPNELDAVVRHHVALLVLVGKARHAELAESFVWTMPRLEAFLSRHVPPFVAKVYRARPAELKDNLLAPGSVVPWYP
jgi:hypothetical protein